MAPGPGSSGTLLSLGPTTGRTHPPERELRGARGDRACRCEVTRAPSLQKGPPRMQWLLHASRLEIFGAEPRSTCDSSHHPWAYLFSVVEGEGEVRPSGAFEETMGTLPLALDAPAYPQQGGKHQPGFAGRPLAHAGRAKTWPSSGVSSPCSIRSARMRSASASTLATASSRVCP